MNDVRRHIANLSIQINFSTTQSDNVCNEIGTNEISTTTLSTDRTKRQKKAAAWKSPHKTKERYKTTTHCQWTTYFVKLSNKNNSKRCEMNNIKLAI